jgi:hypothetical protein
MRLRLLDRVRRSLGRRSARREKALAAESRTRANRAGRLAMPRDVLDDVPSEPGSVRGAAGQAPDVADRAPTVAGRAPGATGRAPGTIGSHRRGAAPRLVLPEGNSRGGRAASMPGQPAGESAGPGGPVPGAPGSSSTSARTSATPADEARTRPAPRRWGAARAAVRTAPDGVAAGRAVPAHAGRAGAGHSSAGRSGAGQSGAEQPDAEQAASRDAVRSAGRESGTAKLPWYEIAHSNRTAAGRRHCGRLEEVVRREWAPDVMPPPESVIAIDRLAELPQLIKEKLAAGLDAIHVGPGGVPDLDDMGRLSGVPLPSGRATWDACAGAYGERKIVVGSRPSPSPDVMCHEIGHALDDLDGTDEQWQSDSVEFIALYERCLPHVVSDFHRQRGTLGRREFFADAFAAIASRQRPALVDMVGGDTRAALDVMLYFNVRYGI